MQLGKSLTIEGFIESIADFSFQEKYFKWQSYVKNLKKEESQYYQAGVEKFLEYYPFNHTYWNEIIEILVKMPKGKVNTLKMYAYCKGRYQVALAKNPKCITLCKSYLDWLRKELVRSDPNYLKNQIEATTKSIGHHYKAAFVFQYYFEIETNVIKKYNMMKKAMVSPLENIETIYQIFLQFVDSSEFSPFTIQIAQIEGLSIHQTTDRDSLQRILKEELKARMEKLYLPTKEHVLQRSVFESKITIDEYQPFSDSIDNWRKYISFIKNSGNHEFLPSIYERALITQCDNEALWEQYFMILQNQGDHQRVLYLLRSHSLFFRTLSKELTYYWLEIEERENPVHSRQLYLELQKCENDLQIFIRHIQLQLRSKEINNVRALYMTILTSFSANVQIIAFILIQYVEFYIKYFRDISYAKLILKEYFNSYPFNEYLFFNYLEFFVKHIEYKESTKEAKEVADEFINTVLLGLKKAYDSVSGSEYKRIKKRVNNQMRNYILSIYLIKGAERKIKEQEIALKENGKREREGEEEKEEWKRVKME